MQIELWAKAIHIIAVISWMAGLLYLPRLFVYHATAAVGSELSETLKVMENRLLRLIMNPAMMVTWIFGFLTGYLQGQLGDPWLHAKLLLVVLMTAAHMAFAKYRRELEEDKRARNAKFFRIANEVPTVLMVLIVFLVILKPF